MIGLIEKIRATSGRWILGRMDELERNHTQGDRRICWLILANCHEQRDTSFA